MYTQTILKTTFSRQSKNMRWWSEPHHSPWLICLSFRFGQGLMTQEGGGLGGKRLWGISLWCWEGRGGGFWKNVYIWRVTLVSEGREPNRWMYKLLCFLSVKSDKKRIIFLERILWSYYVNQKAYKGIHTSMFQNKTYKDILWSYPME